jgi:hypothetical protein
MSGHGALPGPVAQSECRAQSFGHRPTRAVSATVHIGSGRGEFLGQRATWGTGCGRIGRHCRQRQISAGYAHPMPNALAGPNPH